MAHFAVRFDFPEYLQDKLNIINNGIILRGIAAKDDGNISQIQKAL